MSAEPLNFTLEVVVPVSEVDRSMAFYVDKAGFEVDNDTRVSDAMRIVQLTPRGSGCTSARPRMSGRVKSRDGHSDHGWTEIGSADRCAVRDRDLA
jgi:hypothetical protein